MDAFDTAKNLNQQNTEDEQNILDVKYCPNCGANLEGLDKCPKCGCLLGEIEEQQEEKYKAHGPKNFILKYGRIIIDIGTYFWFLIALLVFLFFAFSFVCCYLPAPMFGSKDWYFTNIDIAPYYLAASIIIPLIILIIVILLKYFVYLLIDIRDTLKNIEQNTRKKD